MAKKHPAFFPYVSLWCAILRECKKQPAQAADFLAQNPVKGSPQQRRLAVLHRAFCLVLAGRSLEALPELQSLLSCRDAVPSIIGAYLVMGIIDNNLLVPDARDAGLELRTHALARLARYSGEKGALLWMRRFRKAAREAACAILTDLAHETATMLRYY